MDMKHILVYKQTKKEAGSCDHMTSNTELNLPIHFENPVPIKDESARILESDDK